MKERKLDSAYHVSLTARMQTRVTPTEPSVTNQKSQAVVVAGLMAWSLVPLAAMWAGLYYLKSAAWTFALYHIVCLLPAIYIGRHLWLPSFRKPKTADVTILVLVSLVFSLVATGLYEYGGNGVLSSKHAIDLMQNLGWSKQFFWPVSLYAIFVNPFAEEIFWRGVVLNRLERANLPMNHFPLLWSSCAYALFHYVIFSMVMYPFWAIVGTVMLASYGALMGLLYKKTGSIVTTALSHGLLTDMAAVALMVDLSSKYPGALL